MTLWFSNDNNEILRKIQFDLYPKIGGSLFRFSADRYLESVRFIGIETDLYKELSEIIASKGYNFSILEPVYDLISAYFRFTRNPNGQLPLILNEDQTMDEYFSSQWLEYFFSECRDLASNDRYSLLLIRIIVYQNNSEGYTAFHELLNELKTERYIFEK